MARVAAPIRLTPNTPELSPEEIAIRLGQATGILLEARRRREERLAKERSFALAALQLEVQEEKSPAPKVGKL